MEEITQQSKILAIKWKGSREEGKKKVWGPGMQGMGGWKFGFNPPPPSPKAIIKYGDHTIKGNNSITISQ